MGERLLCKQEVIGSIPFTSTRQRLGSYVIGRVEADFGRYQSVERCGVSAHRLFVIVNRLQDPDLIVPGSPGIMKPSVNAEYVVCGFAPVRDGLQSSAEGHLVDALALRGDEGRGTLR